MRVSSAAGHHASLPGLREADREANLPLPLRLLLRTFAERPDARRCLSGLGAFGECGVMARRFALATEAVGLRAGMWRLEGAAPGPDQGAAHPIHPAEDPDRWVHHVTHVDGWAVDWTARQFGAALPAPLVQLAALVLGFDPRATDPGPLGTGRPRRDAPTPSSITPAPSWEAGTGGARPAPAAGRSLGAASLTGIVGTRVSLLACAVAPARAPADNAGNWPSEHRVRMVALGQL